MFSSRPRCIRYDVQNEGGTERYVFEGNYIAPTCLQYKAHVLLECS